MSRTLFSEDSQGLEELKRGRIRKLSNPKANAAIHEIPDVSEQEFVESSMANVGVDIPSFDFEHLKREEVGTPGKERLVIRLQVEGELDLLELPPADEESSPVEVGDVDGQWLVWEIPIEGKSAEEVSAEINETLAALQNGLDGLRPRLEEVNEEIRDALREMYRERTEEMEKNREVLDNIEISPPGEESG